MIGAVYLISRGTDNRGRKREPAKVRLVRYDRSSDPSYGFVLRYEDPTGSPFNVGDEFTVERAWFAVRGEQWPREGGVQEVQS